MRLAQAGAPPTSGTLVADAGAAAAADEALEMTPEGVPEIGPAVVLEMIRGVRNFVADFLT